MSTTTDFDGWLDDCGPEDADEAHSLEQSILTGEDWGIYSTKTNNNKIFVYSSIGESVLMLASDKARDAFLNRIRAPYGFDLGFQCWFDKQMRKDD